MSHRFPWIRRHYAGFTLLEMLVVLVLAAMTVALVGGGAQSFMDRARYHQAIRDITTQLNQARALGLQEAKAITVVYQSETRQLIVDGRPQIDIPASLQVSWESVERRPKNDAAAGELIFVFNADGGARGGKFSVSRGGQGVVFRVNWLLGTIEQAPGVTPS